MLLSIIIPVQKLKKEINPRYFYKKVFGLQDTIDSIFKHFKFTYELVIVVNGNSDDALDNYLCSLSKVRIVRISENVGVSRAWNIGANVSVGKYLCFCNDDVEFEDQSIEKLIKIFKDIQNVGQVGPEGGEWNYDKSGKRKGQDVIEEVDEISGYFFIIPQEVFYKVGGFDIKYSPAGCEEIDMSFNLRSKGYRCIVVPHTGIKHHGFHGISSKKTVITFLGKSITTHDLDIRNKKYFVEKWYNGSELNF